MYIYLKVPHKEFFLFILVLSLQFTYQSCWAYNKPQNYIYTAQIEIQCKSKQLTCMFSLWSHSIAACRRAFITEVYASSSRVYFPTRVMVTSLVMWSCLEELKISFITVVFLFNFIKWELPICPVYVDRKLGVN